MPMGDVMASEIADKDAFVRRKPWGVCAVITPWNFPFAVPLWMLGPSLVEGNTAVYKPSEDTPAIGQRLVELWPAHRTYRARSEARHTFVLTPRGAEGRSGEPARPSRK